MTDNWVNDAEKALENELLGWDDEITNDGPEFITLTPGEYEFTVTNFERGRFDGSDKLPPCNMAILTLTITVPEGDVNINHRLFLHKKTEGFLSGFFTSIGQKKKGEPFKMNWNAVVGAKGYCEVSNYTNNKGNTYNQIEKFLEPKGQITFTPGEF